MPSIKKVCRLSLKLTVILGTFLGLLYFGRGPLVNLLVRTYLLPELKTQGVSLAFKHLDTDLFSSVTVSDISLTAELPDAATISGDISKATLHFTPSTFWSDPFSGLAASSLFIDGAHFRYDASAQAMAAPPAEDFFTFSFPALPYGIPSLSFRKCAVMVIAKEWRIELDGMSSSRVQTIEDGRGGLAGSLAFDAIQQQGLPFFSQQRQVEGNFVYRPGHLNLSSILIGGKKVLENTGISSSTAGLQADGSFFLAGGKVDFRLDGKGNILQGSIQSHGVPATDIGNLFEQSSAVHGILALQSTFRLDVQHPEAASAELRFKMEKGKVAQYSIDSLSGKLALTNGMISGQKIFLKSAAGNASITSLETKLDNIVHRDYWKALRQGRAEVNLTVEDWQKFAYLLPRRLKEGLETVQCQKLRLEGALSNSVLKVPVLSLQGAYLNARLKGAMIKLPVEIRNWKSALASADVSFGLENVSSVQRYLPGELRHVEGKVQGHARLSGPLASPTGKLVLAGTRMKYRSLPEFAFQAEAKIEQDAVQLLRLSASSGEDRLEANGRFPFSTTKSFCLNAKGQLAQVAGYAAPFQSKGEVAGNLSFTLLAQGEYSNPRGSADLHSSELNIAGQTFRDTSMDLSFDGKRLTVSSAHFISEGADCQLSGGIEPGKLGWQTGRAELDSFFTSWRHHMLRLGKPMKLSYSTDTVNLEEPAYFDSDLGPITVTGSLGLNLLDLKLEADNLQMKSGKKETESEFGQEIAFSDGTLSLTVVGSPAAPSISGHGYVHDLRGGALPENLDGEVSFHYDAKGLKLDRFEINGGPGAKISLAGFLPVIYRHGAMQPLSSPLSLTAGITLPDATFMHRLFPDFIASIDSINGKMNLHGTLDKPLGNASFKVQGLKPAVGNDWLPPGILSADLKLQAEENRLLVETFSVAGPQLDISLGGQVNGNVSLTDLLRLQYGKLAANFDLHGRLQLQRLAWLAERFTALRRVDGQISGDFKLSGPVRHLHVKGDFAIANGEVRSSPELPALRELSGKITIDDGGITFPALTGLLGGAPATASGRIIFAGQKDPSIDFKLAGKNLLLYRTGDIKIRADADLALQGGYLTPTITGKLTLTEGYYRKNIPLLKMVASGVSKSGSASVERFSLFSFTDEPLRDAKFSIIIRAEAPFKVNTNLVKGNLDPSLELTGTGELPQLVGEIYVDNAKCLLPAGPLNIDSGLLRFRQADPDRFFLELSGSAKMMGYDITAKITGPYDEPTIDLSSYPPLGNEELLLLLLTGQRPALSNGTGGSNAELSRVGIYLGRELLTSLFGKENIDDQGILERLQINIGRNITRQGDDTIEAKFLLKKGFLKKNDFLYLTAEKDVWDDYNGGLRLIFRFP